MVIITSIRAPLPVGELVSKPAEEPRPQHLPVAGSAAPVSDTAMTQAVQQVPTKSASADASLLEARMTAETSAAVAAEAARDAYIKASIAAGINPLPLP
jgi:hypothetical protein